MANSTDSKSGICSPAGYNGKNPGPLTAPTKVYPASSKIGKGGSHGSIQGPASKK
jgi:hypothetical protein